MGLFQKPLFHPAFGGFAAEQHLFHAFGFDRGRRDGNEGGARAVGIGMDEAGGHFLARSGRPRQHHAAIRFGDLLQLRFQRLEGGARSQHVGGGDILPAQFGIFAAQARGFHRAADHDHQLVDVEGFLDEVIGALLDRGDGDFDIAMARDDDDRHIGIVALDGFQDVDAIHAAVLQPDIEDHQRGRFAVDFGHAIIGIPGKANEIAFVLEDIGDEFADILFVIYDQNAAHGLIPLVRRGPRVCGCGCGGCAGDGSLPWRPGGCCLRKRVHRAGRACRHVPR